jgi:hypothetical protein
MAGRVGRYGFRHCLRLVGAGIVGIAVLMGPTVGRAGPPGADFRLRPAAKPLVPERSPVGTSSGPFALAGEEWQTVAAPPHDWGIPEPERIEPAARPGEWSTSVDPSLDLGVPRGLDERAPGADLAEMLDPLFVESVTVRLTRHF